MAEGQHTSGRWFVLGGGERTRENQTFTIRCGHAGLFDTVEDHDEVDALANAERACACVNACEGVNPEAIPDMLAALRDVGQALAHAIHKLRDDGVFSTSIALRRASDKVHSALTKATPTT